VSSSGRTRRDLDAIRAGHVDDVFVPVDPDTLAGRLEAVGFADVGIDVGEYQLRFNATKPGGPGRDQIAV